MPSQAMMTSLPFLSFPIYNYPVDFPFWNIRGISFRCGDLDRAPEPPKDVKLRAA